METEKYQHSGKSGSGVPFSFSIGEEHAGVRFDHFLVMQLSEVSRSQLTNGIKRKEILVNGMPAKASRKLQIGDTVYGTVIETDSLTLVPQKVEFEILFEDKYLMLISKPPQLVVHPASGNPDNTLVNGLIHYCGNIADAGDPLRPGIVHRLDKDTSGIMVIAKKSDVHRKLVDLFKSRQVKKKYHALVLGVLREKEGRIAAAIGRHPGNRKKMAIVEHRGKFAATRWKVLDFASDNYSLLELIIETGRTHQIRVHMASLGHAVAGDRLYGPTKDDPLFPRQMLHSSELRFFHPVTGKKIVGIAPLWSDMRNVLTRIGSTGDVL